MRTSSLIGACLLALAAGCGPAIQVRTVVSPEAQLGTLHTFRILPSPQPRDSRPLPPEDPMLANSITNRTLRRALLDGFQSRGYVVNDSTPDFVVAYYAAAKHKLDVTYWDYGYRWRPRWWRGWGPGARPWGEPLVTEYTEGTVIIDVLEPRTNELLWRGRGVAVVSDDVQEYLTHLEKTVTAILAEFPPARAQVARH
ncbi:MAG TPA: DUF4136 domain-containing protein [Gemmatimonadales bacterium]|jgi:hypothetical protein